MIDFGANTAGQLTFWMDTAPFVQSLRPLNAGQWGAGKL
jgi:hypothetical protein